METPDTHSLPDSLLAALGATDKGLALIRKQSESTILTWGNASFFRMLGLEARACVGRDANALLSAIGSAKVELKAAIKDATPWLGWSVGPGEGKLKVRLDALPGGHLGLWVEHDDGNEMQSRMAEALRKVEEVSGVDEKTGLSGPKAFWRSVGSLWAVCARNQLPVSLAMIAVRPHFKDTPGGDYEEAARAAFSKTFRRASDVVGRLGQNSFAVFIVGQDAPGSKERVAMFENELGTGYVASIGLAVGLPLPGSSTHAIKNLAKRMLDKAFESKGSAIEADEIAGH